MIILLCYRNFNWGRGYPLEIKFSKSSRLTLRSTIIPALVFTEVLVLFST